MNHIKTTVNQNRELGPGDFVTSLGMTTDWYTVCGQVVNERYIVCGDNERDICPDCLGGEPYAVDIGDTVAEAEYFDNSLVLSEEELRDLHGGRGACLTCDGTGVIEVQPFIPWEIESGPCPDCA